MATALSDSGFSGFEIGEARTGISENAVDGDVTSLPTLKWLKLTGTPLQDDIGELRSSLMASERLLGFLAERASEWSRRATEVDENGRSTRFKLKPRE